MSPSLTKVLTWFEIVQPVRVGMINGILRLLWIFSTNIFLCKRDRDKRCRVSKISCWALSLFPSMNEVYLTEKSPHLLIFCIKYVSHCDRALISLFHLPLHIFWKPRMYFSTPPNSRVWMCLFLFAIMRI